MEKYKDPEWLREEYHDNNRTLEDMADEVEMNSGTIWYWMKKHSIETHNQGRNKRTPGMNLHMDPSGHPRWWNHIYENSKVIRREQFPVHRLLAISEFGIEAVKGKDVHHKNGIPWDNRPDNLELMTHGEHSTHHNNERIDEIKNQPRDELGRLAPMGK